MLEVITMLLVCSEPRAILAQTEKNTYLLPLQEEVALVVQNNTTPETKFFVIDITKALGVTCV